jgi:hypothetical protein
MFTAYSVVKKLESFLWAQEQDRDAHCNSETRKRHTKHPNNKGIGKTWSQMIWSFL